MLGKTIFKWITGQWGMITFIALLAVFFRARLILPGPLLPGINGGYYPLMVRELLTHGSLPFADRPLLFWLEAGIFKFLNLFGTTGDSGIILAGKITDILFPVLLVFPLFLFSKKRTGSLTISLLLTAFGILFFPMSYLLTGDMHKNALGLVFLVCLFVSIENWRRKPGTVQLIWISLSFLLLFMTHFGTAIAGLLALPLLAAPLLEKKIKTSFRNRLTVISFLPILILIPDRADRLLRLIEQPLRLFEQPFLWHLLDDQWVYTPVLTGFGWLVQILAIGTLILAFRLKKGRYWAILSLFLSSPLIGIEWYLRLTIMAYIPLIFSWIAIWPNLHQTGKNIFTGMLSSLILLSVLLLLPARRPAAISSVEISDLSAIRDQGLVQENDLVVARHGLEWWAQWYLSCPVAQEQAVTQDDFSHYSRVLVLDQHSDNSGHLLRGQSNFLEPVTGERSIGLFKGESLQLHKVDQDWYPLYFSHLQHCTSGFLTGNDRDGWQVTNGVFTYPLILSNEQEKTLSSSRNPDKKYRIYGKKRAFSLQIILDAAQEI